MRLSACAPSPTLDAHMASQGYPQPHSPTTAQRPHLAMTKSSRTMREPSPMYFCTSSEPETRMKVQSV